MKSDQAATAARLMTTINNFAAGHSGDVLVRAALTAALREQYEAGLERAAVIVEAGAERMVAQNLHRGKTDKAVAFAVVEDCAAAIRAVAAEVKAS